MGIFGKFFKLQVINQGSRRNVRMLRFAKSGKSEGQHLKTK
jgi:hypothetical protein